MVNMRVFNCLFQFYWIYIVYYFIRDEYLLGCIVFLFDYKVNNIVY